MNSHHLIILTLIYFIPSITAQMFCNMSGEVEEIEPNTKATSPHNPPPSGLTAARIRSRHSRQAGHHHKKLKAVHGVLNIIGWGIILPIGAIIARYCRNLPMAYGEWYSLHAYCQISGCFLGSIGWIFGMLLRNALKHYTLKTHGILGTIIFALAATQVLATCLKPKEEHECHKYWKASHHALGYALIALIIANIFLGIDKQRPAVGWKWSYVAILGVLALAALALETLRLIKLMSHRTLINVDLA
ncbi:cytochrome b561 and DOMON domain-containing protein At3g25290-like [Diospyros lotus]|uniref:cytochrome b561 and DOMON domain-containing protein At3g25290-like n=1 Tax=Diospyros lotus TaxID=55363 RepID=UPI0022505E03|nr:cytochrome b561 and DOMON domain-containing protein At3g25290-like [Diospyros lotus]